MGIFVLGFEYVFFSLGIYDSCPEVVGGQGIAVNGLNAHAANCIKSVQLLSKRTLANEAFSVPELKKILFFAASVVIYDS